MPVESKHMKTMASTDYLSFGFAAVVALGGVIGYAKAGQRKFQSFLISFCRYFCTISDSDSVLCNQICIIAFQLGPKKCKLYKFRDLIHHIKQNLNYKCTQYLVLLAVFCYGIKFKNSLY